MAKYKVLKAIAHNFTHSFVSFNNYVDDAHVVDELKIIVRRLGKERLSIHWIPDLPQSSLLTERILKSIAYWKADLPRLITHSGGEIGMIGDFRTDFYLKGNLQFAVEGILTDDRGRAFITPICNF